MTTISVRLGSFALLFGILLCSLPLFKLSAQDSNASLRRYWVSVDGGVQRIPVTLDQRIVGTFKLYDSDAPDAISLETLQCDGNRAIRDLLKDPVAVTSSISIALLNPKDGNRVSVRFLRSLSGDELSPQEEVEFSLPASIYDRLGTSNEERIVNIRTGKLAEALRLENPNSKGGYWVERPSLTQSIKVIELQWVILEEKVPSLMVQEQFRFPVVVSEGAWSKLKPVVTITSEDADRLARNPFPTLKELLWLDFDFQWIYYQTQIKKWVSKCRSVLGRLITEANSFYAKAPYTPR